MREYNHEIIKNIKIHGIAIFQKTSQSLHNITFYEDFKYMWREAIK